MDVLACTRREVAELHRLCEGGAEGRIFPADDSYLVERHQSANGPLLYVQLRFHRMSFANQGNGQRLTVEMDAHVSIFGGWEHLPFPSDACLGACERHIEKWALAEEAGVPVHLAVVPW